jgi:hypothetical protein
MAADARPALQARRGIAMPHNVNRILATHVGSLVRPPGLVE